MTVVSSRLTSARNSKGNIESGAPTERGVGKIRNFGQFGRRISETVHKKLSYRRETARQLHTSFSAHSLIVHFTAHCICCTTL